MNGYRALLPLILLAPAALAGEDEACQVDPKVMRPQFAGKLPRGFKLLSTRKQKKQITQVLKLPDGFEATVTAGGCSHVLFTIELEGPAVTTKTVGAELVAIARRVLPTLPLAKDATVDVKLMLEALDEVRMHVMPAQLPCGEATCQLSLEAAPVRSAKGKKAQRRKEAPAAEPAGVLKLSYDFPL